jgi:hypothetical protein
MIKHFSFTLLFIGSISLLFAQDDVAKYFDDGGIATASRLIKGGIDPLNGELAFIYEQQLINNLTVEGGLGFVSLSRQSKLYEDIQKDSGLGLALWANFRYYIAGFYEQYYVGFQPRLNFLDGKTYTDIVFFNGGYQRPISGKLVIDINVGMGVRTYKLDDVTISGVTYDMGRDSGFYVPIMIKLGYAF